MHAFRETERGRESERRAGRVCGGFVDLVISRDTVTFRLRAFGCSVLAFWVSVS